MPEVRNPLTPRRRQRSSSVWLALLAATASIGSADEIRLLTGETLRVSNVNVAATTVEFTHPVLGTLIVPRSSVTLISPPEDATAVQPLTPPQGPEPSEPDEATAKARAKEAALRRVDADFEKQRTEREERVRLNTSSIFSGWKGAIQAGANGSDGNSDSLSMRAGAGAARHAELMETHADISYAYAADNGVTSKSRGEAKIVNDWLFKNSPWGLFGKAMAEYDEFQDWDWRFSAFAGPSYAFLKTDKVTLRGRLGGGVTKEFGGMRNELIPEGLAGMDLEYKFSQRQSIFVTAEYLPSLSNFPQFRINSRAGYKLMIDPDSNLSLNLGVEDRYDSNPGEGFRKNDVDYFVLLGLDF